MCWGYKDVYLEEPPPKREPENNNEYIMVSSEMETPAHPVGHVSNLLLMSEPTHTTLPTSIPNYCTNLQR